MIPSFETEVGEQTAFREFPRAVILPNLSPFEASRNAGKLFGPGKERRSLIQTQDGI